MNSELIFNDVWINRHSGLGRLKQWFYMPVSLLIHSFFLFIFIFGPSLNPNKQLPPLKVIDIRLSNIAPSPPASLRAAPPKTQSRTKLVDQKEGKKKLPDKSPSALIKPVAIPGSFEDEDEIFLTSAHDFGPGGGIEGGTPGGIEGGVVGGVDFGVIFEESPEPVRLNGNPPNLVKYVKPEYPPKALAARRTGHLVVEITTTALGKVKDCQLLIGDAMFDAAALKALKQWEYEPLIVNGVPTPFIVVVDVYFNQE